MTALTATTMVACNTAKEPEVKEEITNEQTQVNDKEKENQTGDQVDNTEKPETDKDKESEGNKEGVKEVKPIDYNEVKPNEIGSIFTAMYHGIKDLPPYHRTAENFKKDLNYMYENGYRPISVEDYVSGNITVEAGMTPIILSFDDGLSSTFALEKDNNGQLVPKEGTAVYIMEEFAKEHPDFGKAAVFYINGDDAYGEGDGTYEERLNWLVDHGYSLGNHTATHPHLNKLNPEQIQKEIGIVDRMIKDAVPGYEVMSIAYPFGQRPADYLDLVKDGTYDGHKYHYELAYRVGYSAPYVSPYHTSYQPLNHPRLTANEGDDWDLWFAFNYYEENPELRYISDGNPATVAVPKKLEERVNKETLGDKELILY